MNTYKSLIILAFAGFLISGCGQLFATPTPTPLPTNTPTLTPTPTVTPTRTPTPTPTFTPTPNGQVVNLLGMSLLIPFDWEIEIEDKDNQINASIKEPASGVTMQITSMNLDPSDDSFKCSMEYVQPLFKEAFGQMLTGMEAEEMEDQILHDNTTIPRSALTGKFMDLLPIRIEIGVFQKNEICYMFILNGDVDSLKTLRESIDGIYQSMEFTE